jgi:hypothetical protein
MKRNSLIATTAMAVVLAAGAAAAQDLGSQSFAGGVSLLSPEQTGFLYGGTAEVTGLGSAAVVISAETAEFNMTGFSNSGTYSGTIADPTEASEAVANSGVLTTFDFGRTVTVSASGIGAGRVVARGDANAAVGAVGSAFGDTLSNEISSADAGSLSSTSRASSESAASLVGDGSTSVLAGLVGTTNGFVGSTGTTVNSLQSGIAYSALNAIGDKAGSGINIGPGPDTTLGVEPGDATTFFLLKEAIADLNDGYGVVGFSNTFTLGGPIDLAVANVGGGTISLGASTGGFFGGGAATSGLAGYGSIFKEGSSSVAPVVPPAP